MNTKTPQRRSTPYAPPSSELGVRKKRRRSRPNPQLRARAEGTANVALVLGVVSLFCALAAPFAIWQGNLATAQAHQARIPVPSGATVGKVLGWIVLCLTLALLILYAGIVVAVVA
ncbi:MAG: hypothetical protein R3F62_25680 [Planctomycetota bacterium]